MWYNKKPERTDEGGEAVLILKKLNRKGRFLVWIATVGVIFLATALLILGIFSLVVSPDSEDGTIFYKQGTGSRKDKTYEVSRALYCPDGVYYFNFASMAEACGFSTSGDENETRYIIEVGDGDYDTVTFYYGSREVTVNGSHIMLSAPVKKSGSKIMVPCEFISLCMKGVTVETTQNQITLKYDIGKISLKPDLDPMPPVTP